MSALIQLNNISKNFGTTEIFDKVNVSIFSDSKIGVIGRNGAGKSTLCKIITGEEEPGGGTVDKSPALRISYLEQHNPFEPDETVKDFLVRYTGREEWKCGKIAGRFQLKNELYETVGIGNLSGGYQTRVKIAAMLVKEPNFLILDEPTNFLDLHTLLLLEKFLQEYSGAFMIVSHDREFLKKTCNQTLEIENGGLFLFPGRIEEYFAFKSEQTEQKIRQNKNIEIRQKQLQAFITRFRAKATKARQVKSKMKLSKRLRNIEIEHPLSTVKIRIPRIEERKGYALACEGLAVGYPEKLVAENIDLHVDKGTHIAVLGDNGQGKTTFLRTIAGAIPPLSGKFKWAKHMEAAFYEQNVYDSLDPEDDVFHYLQNEASTDLSRQDILNMAGSFLFKGDDVLKPVKVLSGGERARLCLAGMLLSKKPVLLLDEPTNHLDFETVEALGAALRNYKGAILFVSHDRTFVNMTATGIIDVKDGRIVHYPGTYEDYVYHLEQLAAGEIGSGEPGADSKNEKAEKKKSTYHLRKEIRSKIKKLQKKLQELEGQNEAYEKEKNAIINIFSLKPESYSTGQNQRLDDLIKLIDERENEWFAIQEEIEELREQV